MTGVFETFPKLEVMGTQGLECAESGSDDVEERKLKLKERKSEAMQVQGNGCSMASPGIKTLKVKKVVRVTTTSQGWKFCTTREPGS